MLPSVRPMSCRRRRERQPVQRRHRQVDEQRDAVLEVAERGDEGTLLVDVAAFDGGRVLDAPVRGDRLARPQRTGFAGGVVADGQHEIHPRCVRPGEHLPALGGQPVDRIAVARQHLEGEGIDRALRHAAGREGVKAAAAVLAQDGFGHDRARRVSRAEEQDVEGRHVRRSLAARDSRDTRTSCGRELP